MAPSRLFTWRRDFRSAAQAAGIGLAAAALAPFFVPAVIDPQTTAAAPERTPSIHKRRASRTREAAVELEIDGVAVKIARGADAGVIAALIEALKAAR